MGAHPEHADSAKELTEKLIKDGSYIATTSHDNGATQVIAMALESATEAKTDQQLIDVLQKALPIGFAADLGVKKIDSTDPATNKPVKARALVVTYTTPGDKDKSAELNTQVIDALKTALSIEETSKDDYASPEHTSKALAEIGNYTVTSPKEDGTTELVSVTRAVTGKTDTAEQIQAALQKALPTDFSSELAIAAMSANDNSTGEPVKAWLVKLNYPTLKDEKMMEVLNNKISSAVEDVMGFEAKEAAVSPRGL